MPGGDRTGPLGEGPMTGGGFGYCSGGDTPGYGRPRGNRFAGKGQGLGCKGGWGGRGLNQRRRVCRRQDTYYSDRFYPLDNRFAGGSETELLRRDAQQLEVSLDRIKKRLSELENLEKEKQQ